MGDETIMQPTRDPQATLPDLIEVLLNKGVYLNLDLIISVADIPLIGVNLRATIAGIETMLEYGMMRQWDEETRKWVQQSVRAHLPLDDDEEILAKMAGGHYQDNFYRTWRPGRVYLTSKRLIVHRRDPAETLWQARLNSIASVAALSESSIGGGERTRILIRLVDGTEAKLSAIEPERLIDLVRGQRGVAEESEPAEESRECGQVLREGHMWCLETLSTGSTWRGGHARLTQSELVWKSPLDTRARVRVAPAEVQNLRWDDRDNPTDEPRSLVLDTAAASVHLAAGDIADWQKSLGQWSADESRIRPAEGTDRIEKEMHDDAQRR
jgi:hypothetical protein